MPALLILAFISWLLGAGKSRFNSDLPLFNTLQIRRRTPWGAFAVSLALHAAAIPLLVFSSEFLRDDEGRNLAQWMAERSLVIKLPERVYLAQSSGEAQSPTPTASLRTRLFAAARAAAGSQEPSVRRPSKRARRLAAEAARVIKTPPRRFELPELARMELRVQTLIQAELPPNLPPEAEKSLPQLLFWAADPRDMAKRQPVTPGNRTLVAQRPALDAPPTLSPPNREIFTSDLRIASAVLLAQPALPRPAATTMPIRVFQPPPAQPVGGPRSIDPFLGDPIHVLAVSPNPAPLSEALKPLFVPAGNQIARLPGVAGQFGGDASPDARAAGTEGRNGTGDGGRESTASAGSGTGSPSGAGAQGSPAASVSPAIPSEAGSPATGATVVHALPGDGQVLGLLSPPALPSTAIQVIHPANGTFDVIVVQSSPAEAFPEIAHSLSGRPVYTVYVQVGSAREWVLQYCIPNSGDGLVQMGNLVKLGNPAPLVAPYAIMTVRPPLGWHRGDGYLLVHGFLDASGRFRDMAVVSQDSSAADGEILLRHLAHWEFRPALQDGRSVLVEIVLAVPPDKA